MSFRSIPERREIETRPVFEWDLRRFSVNIFWISCFVILWAVVLFLGFLLLGTLRSLGLLSWRLEQLDATTPKRLGRDGFKPRKKAPDFTLPSANGKGISLHDFAGRKVFLVFTRILMEKTPKPSETATRLAPPGWTWRDWLLVQLGHREARQVLKKQTDR
jgi:hypothetical protein